MRRAVLLISIALAAFAVSLTLGGTTPAHANCLPGMPGKASATSQTCACGCDVAPRRQMHFNDRHVWPSGGFARIRYFINAKKRAAPPLPAVKARYDKLKKVLKKNSGLIKQHGLKWFKRHFHNPKQAGKEAISVCLVAGAYTLETSDATTHKKKLWQAARNCSYAAINFYIISPPK